MRYTCRCCGYKTLDEPSGGTYEICELCGWEDDGVQSSDPDYVGGANGMSLREAQHAFLAETPEKPMQNSPPFNALRHINTIKKICVVVINPKLVDLFFSAS